MLTSVNTLAEMVEDLAEELHVTSLKLCLLQLTPESAPVTKKDQLKKELVSTTKPRELGLIVVHHIDATNF